MTPVLSAIVLIIVVGAVAPNALATTPGLSLTLTNQRTGESVTVADGSSDAVIQGVLGDLWLFSLTDSLAGYRIVEVSFSGVSARMGSLIWNNYAYYLPNDPSIVMLNDVVLNTPSTGVFMLDGFVLDTPLTTFRLYAWGNITLSAYDYTCQHPYDNSCQQEGGSLTTGTVTIQIATPSPPVVSVTPTTVQPGGYVTVTMTGTPLSPASIYLGQGYGFRLDANGQWTGQIRVGYVSGPYVVVAYDGASGLITARASAVTVTG